MSEVTKAQNVIIPEVMGAMIEAKINALCKLTPYAKVDTTLVGVPGDTKTVPSWNYIGDAEDFNPEDGNEMDTVKLTCDKETFTIKCAGKSVAIYQTAINSGLGNPIGQAETQLAKSIVGKVDNDVIDAAYRSNNVMNSNAVIGYKGVVDAVTKFEDEEDGVDKVMFIHPKQEATILKDSDFLSADKFTAGVAVNGAIGKIAGCWVKKSKKVKTMVVKYVKATNGSTEITEENIATIQANCLEILVKGDKVNTVSSQYEVYMNPIIKLEPDSEETEYTEDELAAITIFLKKDTQLDHEWFPKKQRHDVTAAKYYGVALTNASKVVIARFKTA